jgi:Fic family protein
MAGDRHTAAQQLDLITDPHERTLREAENAVRQYAVALDVIRTHVHDAERPFRLRSSLILRLHKEVLDGIHMLAGTFRNTPVKIGGSGHQPVEALMVSEETEHLCEYVNDNWPTKSALHLAAYVLWRLNWIHSFADGNGRTARTVSYVVLSIKLEGLLPGVPTIPDQIASDKTPYYVALEAADAKWKATKQVDVSQLEAMLEGMLAKQLVAAVNSAAAAT